MAKPIDFMRKHVTAFETLVYDSYFLSNRGQVTIQNNLDSTNTLFKSNDFKSKKLLRKKMNCLNLICYIFHQENMNRMPEEPQDFSSKPN